MNMGSGDRNRISPAKAGEAGASDSGDSRKAVLGCQVKTTTEGQSLGPCSGSVPEKAMSDKCCNDDFHHQIEYPRVEGGTVESLTSHNFGDQKARQFLHDSLDEWLNAKRSGGDTADHFIVFRKWPETDALS